MGQVINTQIYTIFAVYYITSILQNGIIDYL